MIDNWAYWQSSTDATVFTLSGDIIYQPWTTGQAEWLSLEIVGQRHG